jgi:hypothetical protein
MDVFPEPPPICICHIEPDDGFETVRDGFCGSAPFAAAAVARVLFLAYPIGPPS